MDKRYTMFREYLTQDALSYLCKKVASMNSDVRLLEKYLGEAKKMIKEDEGRKNKVRI